MGVSRQALSRQVVGDLLVEKAEEIINLISGDDVDARKEWIMNNPYAPEVVEFNEEVE